MKQNLNSNMKRRTSSSLKKHFDKIRNEGQDLYNVQILDIEQFALDSKYNKEFFAFAKSLKARAKDDIMCLLCDFTSKPLMETSTLQDRFPLIVILSPYIEDYENLIINCICTKCTNETPKELMNDKVFNQLQKLMGFKRKLSEANLIRNNIHQANN